MARIETDPNYSSPTFSRATAGTDLFKKEDVQALAAAVSTHDHTAGKGAVLVAGSIPAGSITSGMIADATIDTADLKDGAVTSAKIADGTIATADHADASVTNAKLASDTARANLLTNGGFEIWQRGDNFNAPASGITTADRWVVAYGGSTFPVFQKDTGNIDANSRYCLAFSYTHGTAGEVWQKVEDYYQLRGKTVTFSIRVKCSTANAIRAFVQPSGVNTYSSYHTGGGAYETLTVTVAIPANATSIVTGVVMSASSGANYLDNAMLVVGSVAADYAPLHPADDLARCLRYYEAFAIGNGGTFFTGTIYGANNAKGVWNWKVGKAVTPSLTFNAANSYVIYAAGTSHICSAVVSHGGNLDQAELNFTTAGAPTVGQASLITANNPAGMYCEANP